MSAWSDEPNEFANEGQAIAPRLEGRIRMVREEEEDVDGAAGKKRRMSMA